MPIDPNFDFALGDVANYRAELLADAEQIIVRSDGPLDEEDQTAFDSLTAEIERADADAHNRAKMKQLTHVDEERFEMPRVNVNLGGARDVYDLATTERLTGPRKSEELRGRALHAIENAPGLATDEAREAATALVENDGAQFSADGSQTAPRGARADHILRHGSPQYVSEFQDFMRNPARGPSNYLRAMSEGSSSVGGAVVPYFLDPTIILTNAGVVSPIRNLATVKTITTNIWHGVTSAGVTAEWIAEATEVADASPTFAAPSIQAYKADAYVQGSIELISDAAISGEIAGLLGEAKSRLEGTAFAVGTGTAQPRGLITAASGNTVAGASGAAGANDLVAADIFALANALPVRWRGNGAQFLAAFATINKIRQLNSGTAAYQSTFWADFGGAVPPNLIGYPIHEVSDMDSTIVSGSNDDVILFGDIKQYYVIDRMGMEIAYNPLVIGSSRRPTGESGWVAFWRQGADAVYSAAFRTLRL